MIRPKRLWIARPVCRPDAAYLYNAVDQYGVEAQQTPTHDLKLADEFAKFLNERESKKR